jgi:hypothetical protein
MVDGDCRLLVVELGRGHHVRGRDVQEVVARVALEGAVLGVFELLTDRGAARDGADVALLLEAARGARATW